MIKRCPSCNRTYSDESISFCLADGALLSAPFDGKKDEAPPTEILPSPQEPPPTEPAKSAVPTMTSLPGGPNYPPFEREASQPKRRPYGAFIWAALALLIVGGIVIGILGVRKVLKNQSETAATASPEQLVAQGSPNASSTPEDFDQTKSSVTATPTPVTRPTIPGPDTKTASPQVPATIDPDPVLTPPKNEATTASPPADNNRVFNSGEVDLKPRVLSKPAPSYTESARTNQVNGTVVLRVVFSAAGSVTNISVVRGLPDGLSEKAIAAARQIKFVPGTKDGRPVSVSMLVEYNFNLY